MFLLHGRDLQWPCADRSACSFSPNLCWTGLTACRGEKLQLVSFVQELQRGSRSLPRLFQLKAGIYQHANLHIRHGSHCVAPGQEGRAWVREDGSHEESGVEGPCSPFGIHGESPLLKELVVYPLFCALFDETKPL